MCESKGAPTRRGGPPGSNGDKRWVGVMCDRDPDGGGLHGPGNKGKTADWYKPGGGFWGEGNNRQGSWFGITRQTWFQVLLSQGPVAWFRWVFSDLDNHDITCRWRRVCKALGAQ